MDLVGETFRCTGDESTFSNMAGEALDEAMDRLPPNLSVFSNGMFSLQRPSPLRRIDGMPHSQSLLSSPMSPYFQRLPGSMSSQNWHESDGASLGIQRTDSLNSIDQATHDDFCSAPNLPPQLTQLLSGFYPHGLSNLGNPQTAARGEYYRDPCSPEQSNVHRSSRSISVENHVKSHGKDQPESTGTGRLTWDEIKQRIMCNATGDSQSIKGSCSASAENDTVVDSHDSGNNLCIGERALIDTSDQDVQGNRSPELEQKSSVIGNCGLKTLRHTASSTSDESGSESERFENVPFV